MLYKDYDYLFKLLIIGDSGVGKSSILFQFSDKTFQDEYSSTIGVDLAFKHFKIDDKDIKVQLWDCAGEYRFKQIVSAYYRGSNGIFIVYDITDRESFENVKMWMNEIKRYCDEEIVMILVGNKIDLKDDRQIPYEEGKEFADSLDINFYEVSAKIDKNIDEMFFNTIKHIKHEYKYIQQDKPIKLTSFKETSSCYNCLTCRR